MIFVRAPIPTSVVEPVHCGDGVEAQADRQHLKNFNIVVYNRLDAGDLLSLTTQELVLIAEDFNAHHPTFNSTSRTNQDGKQSTSSSVLGVVKEVLATLAYSKFSVFFLTDGSTSASTIFKLEEELPIPGGVGVFEVVVEGQYIDNINTQLSHVICVIKQLRQMSSHTTIVLISDDPAFLAAFAEWSLKSRLLVWSTRLLAVTRLPLQELHHLQRAFSKMNAVLAIINDDSTNHRL
ncbi:uncharacterized protein LOC121873944 [Homarus americanus]|uniref:uncharacterized protein LOC121873944 n=1 Tax=Homarus americanus TaxID=6706 RepID=UPI001C487F00|nr:uncharacterized protein LOC121873944 [Homarus americanus]